MKKNTCQHCNIDVREDDIYVDEIGLDTCGDCFDYEYGFDVVNISEVEYD